MKTYTCPELIRRRDDLICTAANNQPCGNVKYCRMAGRWVLNENSVNCPLRKEKRNAEQR